jgi:hypothetical protein
MKDTPARMQPQPAAVSGWEDEGGATPSAAQRTTDESREQHERHTSANERFDASHDSAHRGEHRYPARHQTASEQQGREDRDNLKKRLAGADKPR